jgi:hypothetical protein
VSRNLIAPYGPASDRPAREQFEVRPCDQAFDPGANLVRLAAVLAIDSKDGRVSLMASNTVLDRAWGKAEARGKAAVVRAFAVVPEVMSEEDWLRTRGNPNLLGTRGDPDVHGDCPRSKR